MANKYQIFVRQYAAKKKLSWNCAICEIKKKELWKAGTGNMTKSSFEKRNTR